MALLLGRRLVVGSLGGCRAVLSTARWPKREFSVGKNPKFTSECLPLPSAKLTKPWKISIFPGRYHQNGRFLMATVSLQECTESQKPDRTVFQVVAIFSRGKVVKNFGGVAVGFAVGHWGWMMEPSQQAGKRIGRMACTTFGTRWRCQTQSIRKRRILLNFMDLE